MKRAISLILALVLTAGLPPARAAAASPAYGSDVWLQDTALQDGVVLSENIFWSGSYDKPRHEYYITYTPGAGSDLSSSAGTAAPVPSGQDPSAGGGLPDLSWLFPNGGGPESGSAAPEPGGPDAAGDSGAVQFPAESCPYTGVRPVASYGASVCGRSTVSEAARAYEARGYRVVGAINGDFYDTATGYPLGVLISGGEVLSGSSEYYAVGFRPDGSAVMGRPGLSITAQSGGNSVRLASINKPRVNKAGVTMLTYDYRDDHTTGPSVESDGVNVLAAVVAGKAAVGGTLYLQVEEVAEDAQARALREDQVLLTGAANGYTEGLAFLRSLVPGDIVTVSITASDPEWNEVTEAIGAYYLLVDNGVAQEFEVSAAPRTAIGLKADGQVVFYALDGRQDSVSMGASLGVLAKRMAELGCVTALCLDGGGSTTAVAATPDSDVARLLNSPSDKTQRKVSNHLLLLSPGEQTGVPGGVTLSAGAPAVLAGHTVTLRANVTDTNYFPLSLPVSLTASAGEIADGVFTAPLSAGTVTVTAAYGLFTAQREVLVVDAPGTLSVKANGASSLTVQPEDTVSLTVSGTYNHLPLEVFPEDLTWTVDPVDLGTVDEHGRFTAGGRAGTGTVTASRGGVSAGIPVTVEAGHPFADLAGHPEESYMAQLYRQGVLTGETAEDGLVYAYPERGISRAEFAVLLARYLGLNTADYAGTVIPFEDLAGVESWAGDAIRAMYALGIVGGVDPTHFDPQSPLERAQAVTMLGRALGLAGEDPAPEEGPDLPAEPAPDGETAAQPPEEPQEPQEPEESGIPEWLLDHSGEAGERGEPALPEERAAVRAAYLLSRAEGPDLSDYADADQIPEYALAYFRVLVARGAVSGSGGLLRPGEPMTRGDVCKALVVLRSGTDS